MNKRLFTNEQVEELLRNKHVKKCSDKTITYTSEFKVMAVRRYEDEGLTPAMVFEEAGFNLDVIGVHRVDDRMFRWRKIYREKGESGLQIDGRSTGNNAKGRPRTKNLTDTQKIEYLEAKIAYLKAENVFLAKLRRERKQE